MKKWILRVAGWSAVLFLGIQLVPVGRTNPPVDPQKKLTPPPEVEAILRQSCYDCHSDETVWPWYSYVAPVSWWIANHVNDGRRALDLSQWADIASHPRRHMGQIDSPPLSPAQYQSRVLGNMETTIMEGQMPIPSYLIMHPQARMTPEQYKIVSAWLDQTMAQLTEPPTPNAAK